MIQKFEFNKTDFEGAYLITPFCATDIRGAFIKDYSQEVFEQNGITHDLKEVFYTVSHKGVIRALHFQRVREQRRREHPVRSALKAYIADKDSSSQKRSRRENNCLRLVFRFHPGDQVPYAVCSREEICDLCLL